MPPSHQESAPLAYILALPVKNGPLPEKLKSSESTAALDEYFQPVKNLGIWVFCSHRTTLTLQKYRCQAIQSLVWTGQKYWTIPWERSVVSNFSTGQKICSMPCEHKIWLSFNSFHLGPKTWDLDPEPSALHTASSGESARTLDQRAACVGW